MLVESSGGFLVYGIVIAVMNKITEKSGGVKKKSFSCEGCPSNKICNKTSCEELTEITAETSDVTQNVVNAEVKEVTENA